MAASLGKDVTLDESLMAEISTTAQEFTLSRGIIKRSEAKDENGSALYIFVPFTLYPSLVPRRCFEQIRECMADFNTLINRVAHDHIFLEGALKEVIKVDDFTRGLWQIYIKVRNKGFRQPFSLGLHRNDFMLENKDPSNIQVKQVEFNTMAAGLAGLGSTVFKVHRFTLDRSGKRYENNQVPENDCCMGMATGFVKAWELYGSSKAVIMFLVLDEERYVFDQREMEYKIYTLQPRVRVIRRTIEDVASRGILTDDNKLILIEDGLEIAVIYMRSGYGPQHYPTQKQWDARLMMELSLAIKCPSIHYQLAGTKKIQQELARPGSVEKFIKDEAAVARIKATFAEFHTLDLGPEGDEGVRKGLKEPHMYVLKPQREGGGNNLFGKALEKFLKEKGDSAERSAYILMERLVPPAQKNYLVAPGKPPVLANVVNELGVFGAFIGSANEEILNIESGTLIRTKIDDVDEGGMSVGTGFLDSPFLVDDDSYHHMIHA